MTARVLIVEDDVAVQELLCVNLQHAGYDVDIASTAQEAQGLLAEVLPDVVVLDWMLPDSPGLDLAKRWRSHPRTKDLPIIMVTARGEEHDKISGLHAGADDYLTKPFSPRELLARIHAVLRRRAPEATADAVEIDGLRLEPANYRASGDGATIHLGPTEFRLLHYLMTRTERVHSRAQLLDAVWGDHVYIEERTVDVHIRRLRAALHPTGHDKLVETVRGGGYRMSARPRR